MLSLVLMEKILSLFIVILCGFIIVRLGILKAEDSKIISLVLLWIVYPAVTLAAFQIENTGDEMKNILATIVIGFFINVGYVFLAKALRKPLKLNPAEESSMVYSNAGNLLVPLVTMLFGSEYVIYTMGYMSIQTFGIWGNAKRMISGEKKINYKELFLNVNIISVFIGFIFFALNIKFPPIIGDSIQMLSNMVGPGSMLIVGMIIGGMDLKRLFTFKRLLIPTAFRLFVFPIICTILLKISNVASLLPDGEKIILILLLGASGPVASMITQFSQLYSSKEESEYASAINVVSTLLCVISMPLMVYIFQI